MAITYGFFDSNNGDRVYNAKDFSRLFNMVIPGKSGIFDKFISDNDQEIGKRNIFLVDCREQGDTEVFIDKGLAWIHGTWINSSSTVTIPVTNADASNDRWDAVVIKSDQNSSSRANTIEIVEGTPSPNPQYPDLSPSGNIYYLPLAYILREAGDGEDIWPEKITDARGTESCPWIPYMADYYKEVQDDIAELEQEIESAALMTESRVRQIADEEINSSITAAINGSY